MNGTRCRSKLDGSGDTMPSTSMLSGERGLVCFICPIDIINKRNCPSQERNKTIQIKQLEPTVEPQDTGDWLQTCARRSKTHNSSSCSPCLSLFLRNRAF